MASKILVQDVGGFNTSIQHIYEDWELLARLAFAGATLWTTNYPGALYRRHERACSESSTATKRALGHVEVMRSICREAWKRPDLIGKHGMQLFWSTWSAFHRGQNEGISRAELDPLVRHLERLVREGPPELRRLKFARLIRLCGVRFAERIRNLRGSKARSVHAAEVPVGTGASARERATL
jgi:hypothetical protein